MAWRGGPCGFRQRAAKQKRLCFPAVSRQGSWSRASWPSPMRSTGRPLRSKCPELRSKWRIKETGPTPPSSPIRALRHFPGRTKSSAARPFARPCRFSAPMEQAGGRKESIRSKPKVRRTEQKSVEAFPELALAADLDWQALEPPVECASLRALVRTDSRRETGLRLPKRAAFDLELVVSDEESALERDLRSLALQLAALGRRPEHVIAMPRAYMKSHQPGGPWPPGATPNDAARAARIAFPELKIGRGALTNFTEFNRCPPDVSAVDYVTHGSSAIVHAADDRSVFQTLEALPDIFRSARRLAPEKPYRLGLISIGMRSNPYGAALSVNSDHVRRTMCADDPRTHAMFGAAWLVGVAASTQGCGVELLNLADLGGPFGVRRGSPSFHALLALARMQNRPRLRMESEDPQSMSWPFRTRPDFSQSSPMARPARNTWIAI